MADLSAAIAAAREAVQELDGFKHPELADAYLAHCVGTLRDLLAALDAAQGEAVAWRCTGDEIRCFDGNGCECAMRGKAPPAAVPVHVSTLRWWRELAQINPADLVPRIDAVLAAANKENTNG